MSGVSGSGGGVSGSGGGVSGSGGGVSGSGGGVSGGLNSVLKRRSAACTDALKQNDQASS